MGGKLGDLPLFGEGSWVSTLPNTMLLGSRPISVPSGILIHPAIWPQQIWAKNWGSVPLWGRGAGSATNTRRNVARAEAHLHAKFHLDLSNCLATIYTNVTDTGQDKQWSDSIGRTVLQTVAQK